MVNPASKEAPILIVGAGVFGLSTALELAQQGYKNIKVLDRGAEIPSPYSAGCDLNKIVRAEYEDPFYTDLALEAMQQWQSPFYASCYRHLGYVLATSAASPQKARDTLAKQFSSVEQHPAFPAGSFLPIISAADVKAFATQLEGQMHGWKGYINKHAGYARASKALRKVYGACIDLGVSFVTSEDGHATGVLYEERGRKKYCIGVKAKSGAMHFADKTMLCLGAHIAKLLPIIAPQITAMSWAVAHLQLTPEEVRSMIGIPVVNCRDLGFFFEPDEETGMIKLSANNAGYTNYEDGTSIPSSGVNDRIPEEDESKIRRLIVETMPRFADRPLERKFICWCADSADSDFIIDVVPGCEDLMVVAGDSGHAFKMLPIAGRWTRALLEDGEQKTQQWKWKMQPNGSLDDISWRVGKSRDVKDVTEWVEAFKISS